MQVAVEVGLTHGGCLGTAMAFADAIADAGADIYKAQCHAGDACSKYRPGMESYFHESRQEYWRRTAFTHSQWSKLADKCHKRGLKFACSVFSLQGVEMMSTLVDIWKVPSSKTNDWAMLQKLAIDGKPIVLSSGMSTYEELRDAIRIVQKYGRTPTVLQCVSEYPTPPEHIDVPGLTEWAYQYDVPWGLSDHSGELWPGILAASHGAEMLECHITWSKSAWGPDVSSSLTIEQLKQLVDGVRWVERMPKYGLNKDELAKELEPVRRVFRA